ncbi:Restriction of telomere capping protein 5 [Mortierella sp. NVP85]|nr:Restriction of telomere capping protein 5 [Mortierella sp. NVP85]
MGTVQSFLTNNDDPADAQGARSADLPGLSRASNRLHRDVLAKFSEIEQLELRKVFHKLKALQDEQQQELHRQHRQHHPDPHQRVSGITETTFVDFLGIPTSRNRAGHLFFRSFYNLSVYPDSPASLHGKDAGPSLSLKDLVKPLALYCHKVDQGVLSGVQPLKVIFESFADITPDHQSPDTPATTDTTDNSLKGTTTLEWDPEDDDFADKGPSVKAQDLVEILDGLFWLIENVIRNQKHRDGLGKDTHPHEVRKTDDRQRATWMVEHLVNYSKSSSLPHASLDLASESITFDMFLKYVSRNAPNLFEVLSQYFYNLFLIGNAINLTEATTDPKWTLAGDSSVPVLDSQSTILTPENLALVSWFLPLAKTTPTLTNLYSGSEHGFSMNQFEVHVCKYPAPTLLLLLVEPLKSGTLIKNRRQSISFDATRHSHISPTNPMSVGSVLNTVLDGSVTKEEGATGSAAVTPTRKAPRERLVLGAYVSQPWKVSKSGWGNDSFAVFELSPNFEVFPARKSGKTNPAGVSQAKNHYVHFLKNAGIGFGGQASESCLLFMDDNLQYGSYKQDLAGGNVYMGAGGPRQSGYAIDFEVVECEVWGLGGAEARTRQQREWEFERREANRRASIHLRKDGEQEIDRDLLEMAGILDPDSGHRHARRQSAV